MSTVKTRAALLSLYKAKLETSGLDERDGKKLYFEPLLSADMALLKVQGYAGFKIPYLDLDGKPTSFYRVRFLESTKSGFATFTAEKDQRYAQPQKTINEVYLPPHVKWREYLANETAPLIITEGELKAACASKMGFPTWGLGGVWCFRSVENNLPLLPIFDKVSFSGRPVYIIYDSDAATNYQVMLAENALARSVAKLGGEPFIVRLPPSEEEPGKKVGLDDYLLAEGPDALKALLLTAEQFAPSIFLHDLNTEVIYIRDPGVVLRLNTLQRLSPRAFTDHAFSTRVYNEVVQQKDGGKKFAEKSAAKEWLKWPYRAEVERATYAPGQPRITKGRELNTWRGWGCEPKTGDVDPWRTLIAHLFKDSPPEDAKWFEQWFAYPLQNPGVKMASSPLLHSKEQGVGKSAAGYSVRAIYGSNWAEITNEHIHGNFNEWAENKQFVMGDEISGGDKRGSSDKMKSMITQKELRLNTKYVASYTVPDTINYYFTSNHPDAFFLDDKDRRYFIHKIVGGALTKEFYDYYFDEWLAKGGAPNLFAYFLDMDLAGFYPYAAAPMTNSKESMISLGRSDIGDWVARLKEDADSVLRIDRKILPYSLWRSEDLLALYDPNGNKRVTMNGVSREMARAGFRQACEGHGARTMSAGQVRLWMVRNADKLEQLGNAQIGEEYDRERGFLPRSEVKRRKF
jgi:hypothetical protein